MFLKKQNTFKSSSFPIDPVSAAKAARLELSITDVTDMASGRVRTQLYPSSVRISYSEKNLLSHTAILSYEDILSSFHIYGEIRHHLGACMMQAPYNLQEYCFCLTHLFMRLYLYNLRPLIYDLIITFITNFVNVCAKRHTFLKILFKWLCSNKIIYVVNIN